MGQLFQKATEQSSLRNAWQRIRSNGLMSSASETHEAVHIFGLDAESNIRGIQRKLRAGSFQFDPQQGVLKKKTSGGNRGIVMASVQNRIVERAWLDCLQNSSSFVRKVIHHPTSVGGVPNRSVPHGLKLIRDAFQEGKTYFVRSDISGFFDNIPRKYVLDKIAQEIDDNKFMSTLETATTVILANEATLGENRSIFPTNEQGVAQGSPLSPLFGNILLYEFDAKFNGRGIACIRFIDDFVLLGPDESCVVQAFQSAKHYLKNLNLNCHNPFVAKANATKAAHGPIENGFVFLGYDISPGLLQPSWPAREKLEQTIDSHLSAGRLAVSEVRKAANSFENRQRYAQTLSLVDKVLRGWGEAFAYGNAAGTIEALDSRIDAKIRDFRHWFAAQIENQDWKTRRRLGGVCLLGDVKSKSLDDLPFVLEASGRFVRSSKTVTISTDGSIASRGRRKGKDQGPGGWAFVVHETGEEKSGRVLAATNNQMELRAVIEAMRFVEPSKTIVIRTDSQYVSDAINRQTVIKSNSDLWREFREVRSARRVKIVWIEGHAGDPHNEVADRLASRQANLALAELGRVAA